MGVGAGLYMYDVVVEKFTFAISSPDEFLSKFAAVGRHRLSVKTAPRHTQKKTFAGCVCSR